MRFLNHARMIVGAHHVDNVLPSVERVPAQHRIEQWAPIGHEVNHLACKFCRGVAGQQLGTVVAQIVVISQVARHKLAAPADARFSNRVLNRLKQLVPAAVHTCSKIVWNTQRLFLLHSF